MSAVGRLKFLICTEVGCPHPRYLDMYLTPGDYYVWAQFLASEYRKQDDGN